LWSGNGAVNPRVVGSGRNAIRTTWDLETLEPWSMTPARLLCVVGVVFLLNLAVIIQKVVLYFLMKLKEFKAQR
jgi:hypothetical protein